MSSICCMDVLFLPSKIYWWAATSVLCNKMELLTGRREETCLADSWRCCSGCTWLGLMNTPEVFMRRNIDEEKFNRKLPTMKLHNVVACMHVSHACTCRRHARAVIWCGRVFCASHVQWWNLTNCRKFYFNLINYTASESTDFIRRCCSNTLKIALNIHLQLFHITSEAKIIDVYSPNGQIVNRTWLHRNTVSIPCFISQYINNRLTFYQYSCRR
jgi:hypothetical protein